MHYFSYFYVNQSSVGLLRGSSLSREFTFNGRQDISNWILDLPVTMYDPGTYHGTYLRW